jgi:hypothetical protein
LAWSLLENSQTIAPALVVEDGLRFGLPWLRVWEDPQGVGCDREPFTLTVFRSFSPTQQPLVRKAVWQSRVDLRRLHDPVEERDMPASFDPTITVTDAVVPGRELEALLRSGLDLRLPLLFLHDAGSVTSDVGSVGFDFFTLDQPQAKVSLEWSFDPPAEWQSAIAFIGKLQAFLENCLGGMVTEPDPS